MRVEPIAALSHIHARSELPINVNHPALVANLQAEMQCGAMGKAGRRQFR